MDQPASRWSASSPSEGKTVFAIANHFASKGGDDPLFGRCQQPVRASEVQRHQQAQEVRGFVDQLLAVDANAKVVVLGDLNDFEFAQTADILVGARATTAAGRPAAHAAGVGALQLRLRGQQPGARPHPGQPGPDRGRTDPGVQYDIVHTNSEFHDQDSDHDPQVVRLAIRPGKG